MLGLRGLTGAQAKSLCYLAGSGGGQQGKRRSEKETKKTPHREVQVARGSNGEVQDTCQHGPEQIRSAGLAAPAATWPRSVTPAIYLRPRKKRRASTVTLVTAGFWLRG